MDLTNFHDLIYSRLYEYDLHSTVDMLGTQVKLFKSTVYNSKTVRILINRLIEILYKNEKSIISDSESIVGKYNLIDSKTLYDLMRYLKSLRIDCESLHKMIYEIVLHQSMMQTLAMSEITMTNIDIKTLTYILS